MVRYLRRVVREATDRPRALAAGILADTLARPRDADPPAMEYVTRRVREFASAQDADAVAAEIVYEIGSILVELQERFPGADRPDALRS